MVLNELKIEVVEQIEGNEANVVVTFKGKADYTMYYSVLDAVCSEMVKIEKGEK